jgi:hypothetical protein
MNEIKEMKEKLKFVKNELKIRDALQRLLKNKDFKTVFQDEYFEKEPVRITMLQASPQIDPLIKAQMLNDFQAIGALDQFFRRIMQRGNLAEIELQSIVEYFDNPEEYKDSEEELIESELEG